MANDKYSGSYNAGPQLPSYMKEPDCRQAHSSAGYGHAKRGAIGAHFRRGKAHNRGAHHRDPQHGKPFFRKGQRTARRSDAQHSSAQHRSQGEYPARGESSAA